MEVIPYNSRIYIEKTQYKHLNDSSKDESPSRNSLNPQNSSLDGEIVAIQVHTSTIVVALASEKVFIVDKASKEIVSTIFTNLSRIRALRISKDFDLFVAGSNDSDKKLIIKYNIAHTFSEILQTYEGHKSEIVSLALNASSSLLFSCGIDGSVYSWSCANGVIEKTYKNSTNGVASGIEISEDNKLLAVAFDNKVEIYSTESGKLTSTLKGPERNLVCMKMCNHKDFLCIAGCADHNIYIWNNNNIFPSI